MEKTDLTTHACEQVLRFTRAAHWNDLTEERKVQLGFNMGLMAMALGINKEEGYTTLSQAREGHITMQAFHTHLQTLITRHNVPTNPAHIARPF